MTLLDFMHAILIKKKIFLIDIISVLNLCEQVGTEGEL